MVVMLTGGIGLFLLGMVLMTDGLKGMAGDAMRQVLSRFVRGRMSAVTSGAVSTMVVQSSSATTLTTLGFVSAGLLTFPQAVGVVVGANLGTTSTGWIVSLLGFKLDITMVTLPMIAVGVLMRLMMRGTGSQAGMALAGFGLIFVGIDMLQEAMAGLSEQIDLTRFAGDAAWRQLAMVGVGAVMTVVMQSSSAAVATTLAALHGGAIDLNQAAALVIGQNVGTTVKVAILAIGARTAVKRTALAHILFNVTTAVVALALLGPFVWLVTAAGHWLEPEPGVLTLATFHTAFNVLGVALFLPWLNRFSGVVARMVPERGHELTRDLDRVVASVPAVAVDAARRSVMAIAVLVVRAGCDRLTGARSGVAVDHDLASAEQAMGEVRHFMSQLHGYGGDGGESRDNYRVRLATLHAMDHVTRLIEGLRRRRSARAVHEDEALQALARRVADDMVAQRAWLSGGVVEDVVDRAEALSRYVADERRAERPRVLERTATGEQTPEQALHAIDALHWIDQLAYHAWRAVYHLEWAVRTKQTRHEAALEAAEAEPAPP